MEEMFDTIEANNRARSDREAQAQEARDLQRAQARAKAARRARKSLCWHVLFAVLLVALALLCSRLHWVTAPVAITVIASVCCWLSYWLGAYAQYRFCEGGLLNVRA